MSTAEPWELRSFEAENRGQPAHYRRLQLKIALKGAFMKAVVFRAVGNIQLENVPDPKIQKPNDAIVRLTASAICGTDLHMIRGNYGRG